MPKLFIERSATPYSTVKRRLNKLNIGLYCSACGEFFALIVSKINPAPPLEFEADGPILFQCPLCRHDQHRSVDEIERVVLTERNKRKSHPTLH